MCPRRVDGTTSVDAFLRQEDWLNDLRTGAHLSPPFAQPDLDSDQDTVSDQYIRLYESLRKRANASDRHKRSDDWRLDHASDVAGWFTEELGDVIEKGEVHSSLFRDLHQIAPLLDESDPDIYRRGVVLLSTFESVYFEGHIEYAPVYRALMKLDREIAQGNFDATQWFAKVQSIFVKLGSSGNHTSSMASLEIWRNGLNATSTVLNSLYTLNYYGNPILAEEFYAVILPHVRDDMRMAAIIPLLLATTASQDFTQHSLGSLILPTTHLISTAEFVDGEHSADLQAIVQSVTRILGLAAMNLATAQMPGINMTIQNKLAENIRSLLAKDECACKRPEYTLRTDIVTPTQVRRETEIIAGMMENPRRRHLVAKTKTTLDESINAFNVRISQIAQGAQQVHGRRSRRGGPARAGRRAPVAAHTRRGFAARRSLPARMARHIA